MNIFWLLPGGGGYILADGGCSWMAVSGSGQWWIYLGCWWVVVDIFWLVVGGGGYIFAGGGWWWMVVDGGGYIFAGGGWWWVVVGGGIVQSNPFFIWLLCLDILDPVLFPLTR